MEKDIELLQFIDNCIVISTSLTVENTPALKQFREYIAKQRKLVKEKRKILQLISDYISIIKDCSELFHDGIDEEIIHVLETVKKYIERA